MLLFLSAPAISRFYKEPQLIPVTRATGLVLICNAFGIIQRTLLVKAIDFKTQAKISVIASAGSGIIGIGMAILWFWSLEPGSSTDKQAIFEYFLFVDMEYMAPFLAIFNAKFQRIVWIRFKIIGIRYHRYHL